MEGSETGGAWVGTGDGAGEKKMEGSETGGRGWGGKMEGRDGRCVGGDGAGQGRRRGARREAWIGGGARRGSAGEGRWSGARREVHGWGRGWGGKMEGSDGRRMDELSEFKKKRHVRQQLLKGLSPCDVCLT